MAAAQLYTFIRHANSGAKNYEAADVMMYVIEMRDIYAQYFTLRKAIGLASSFNFFNHNLPDLVVKGMGIDPVDLRSHLAQYRTAVNLLAKKINSFAVPKYFKVFDRTAFINSYLFTDSTSIRGQFYNFVPAGYYTWSPKTSTKGTELIYSPHQWTEGSTKFSMVEKPLSTYISSLSAQIDALFLDTDALTMSGDILKAFPNAELYSINQIPDDYQTSFVMDEDVLAQIENMRSIPLGSFDYIASSMKYDLNIKQENQLINYSPKFTFSSNVKNAVHLSEVPQVLVNSHKDEPDYKDVLEWTRLVSTFKYQFKTNAEDASVTDYTLSVVTSGLETPLGYIISTDGVNTILCTQWDNVIGRGTSPVEILTSTKVAYSNTMTEVSLLSKFDWHPVKYVKYEFQIGDFSEEPLEPLAWFADVKVATTIPVETMDLINDSAIYGAFYSNLSIVIH